jgi:hypothetical protein
MRQESQKWKSGTRSKKRAQRRRARWEAERIAEIRKLAAEGYVPPLDRRRGARNEGPVTAGSFPRGHCRMAWMRDSLSAQHNR